MKSFSLIEMLVFIAVFGIIIAAVFGIVLFLYKAQGHAWQQTVAIGEARRGVKIMAREIREARFGDDGSFPIEKAGDKEFIFYSDIDKDGATERVRYFLGTANSGSLTQECVTFSDGGSCSVSFNDFLTGVLQSASLEVSVEGDFGWNGQEYADISADGVGLGRVCDSGCSDCYGNWEGTSSFDVTNLAQDGSIQFTADSSWRVNDFCDWQDPNHAMKVKFTLSFEEEVADLEHQFKKGVTNPVGDPVSYPLDAEEVAVLSSYVRNAPPIFEYFDENGDKIIEYPARLVDTKLMKIYLVVNVNPNKAPQDYELESYVQIRNLKE